MSKFKVLSYLIIPIALSGCATVKSMPDNLYFEMSQFWGTLNRCHQTENLDAKLLSSAFSAYTYALSTWDYDKQRLSFMHHYALQTADTSPTSCQQVTLQANQMIAQVENHRRSRATAQQNTQQAINSLQSMGQLTQQAGQNYQATIQQQRQTQFNWSEPHPPLYEAQINPKNLIQGQVYDNSSVSSSGRVACHYNRGATLVLPYGQVNCPHTYNTQ